MQKNASCEIDIVIPWVDGGDPEWVALKNGYENIRGGTQSKENNEASRYRDWDILRYLFRSIEKYAPWVRKIHFVTCGQRPAWLNANHPKLHLVNHEDYIPAEYLPTFSSHTIELNFHHIEGLSEQFIYFNDDFFLTAPTEPTDFFVDGLPCDSAIVTPIMATVPGHPFVHYLLNDIGLVNGHFNLRKAKKEKPLNWFNPLYGKHLVHTLLYSFHRQLTCGFLNFHMPSSMLKSTYEQVWRLEPQILDATCRNRFRGLNDVNQYVMSYANFLQNRFVPRSPKYGRYFSVGENHEQLYDAIVNKRYKYIAVNDTDNEIDFEKEKDFLIDTFEKAFPEKSKFEL